MRRRHGPGQRGRGGAGHGRPKPALRRGRTTAPNLTGEQLERIALYEVGIPYHDSYDAAAMVFESPGEMLHWPLNAPRRVENLDGLNVSMTTEYWTETIRRSQIEPPAVEVPTANGKLALLCHFVRGRESGIVPEPLVTLQVALSAKAWPHLAGGRAWAALRRIEPLHRAVLRIRGHDAP